MARKKLQEPAVARPNADWVEEYEMVVNGRSVARDTELKISGERGRFRFVKYVKNGDSEWVDVWGGTKNYESLRSFRPSRIKTVHYKNKVGKNLLKARKAT